jgi:hypothetical protein
MTVAPVLVRPNPAIATGTGAVIVAPTEMAVARLKGSSKLRNWWKAERNFAAAGWTDFVGGVMLAPVAATAPVRTDAAGPNGRPAIVAGSAANPGVMAVPDGLTYWDKTRDFSAQIVVKTGMTTAQKAILSSTGYNNVPTIGVNSSGRVLADFNVDTAGAVSTAVNAILDSRFYVLTYVWDATAQQWRVRIGNGTWLSGSDTGIPGAAKLVVFGGQELEPALTPGSPRYRIPAKDVLVSDILWLDANLYTDSASWDLLRTHWLADAPAAVA